MTKTTLPILLIFVSSLACAQVIGYGPAKVFLDIGPAGYTETWADTTLQLHHGGKTQLYFVDRKVVRHVMIMSNFNLWRSERNLRKYWRNDGQWYINAHTQCRVIRQEESYVECIRVPEKTAEKAK